MIWNGCAVLNCFSHVWLFATLRVIVCQAPLSMGFFRQEYWSGLPCPPPGYLPNPGTEPMSLTSPTLAGWFFTTGTTWEAQAVLCARKSRKALRDLPVSGQWFLSWGLIASMVSSISVIAKGLPDYHDKAYCKGAGSLCTGSGHS